MHARKNSQLKYWKLSKNDEKILQIQNKALELSLFLSLPAAFALIVASEEITSSLFGYGSFDKESVKNSASALFYFSIGLPAFSLIKIFSSFLVVANKGQALPPSDFSMQDSDKKEESETESAAVEFSETSDEAQI